MAETNPVPEGNDMQRLATVVFTAALALSALPAHAQFGGFKLPSLGGDGKNAISDLIGKAANIVNAVKEPTEEEEIAIGREFAATLVGAKPLDADLRLQRYVNALGRWLAQQTERPDLPWTFGVLADPGFNAFATPGGHIFVTRGLIDQMRNEAELAGVLAHEIGHVLKKHHLRAVQKNARAGLLAEAGNSLAKTDNPEVKTYLLNFGRKLYASGLDQSDEFEADRLGVVIAARGGFDPYGLPAVLQMLESHNGNEGMYSLLFKTHPAPGVRIETLDALMGRQFDNLAVSTGAAIPARLPEFAK